MLRNRFISMLLVLLMASCSGGGSSGDSNTNVKAKASAINIEQQVQNNILEVNQQLSNDPSKAAAPVTLEELNGLKQEVELSPEELAAIASLQEAN